MNRSDTAKVLAKMTAYDRRTVGLADVAAWHEIIGDLDYDDCLAAVRDHYTNSREWCMPADIVKAVKAIRRERLNAVGTLVPNDSPDDTAEVRALHAEIRAGRMSVEDKRAYEASGLPLAQWQRVAVSQGRVLGLTARYPEDVS